MFEDYSEAARRIIFFARYEASQFSSPYIETEHLLLGLLRQDKRLISPLVRSSVENSIRGETERRSKKHEKISTAVALPLSDGSKRALAYAAEEAERLGHKQISTGDMLLGLLREEEGRAAKLLNERGVEISALRTELADSPPSPSASRRWAFSFSKPRR